MTDTCHELSKKEYELKERYKVQGTRTSYSSYKCNLKIFTFGILRMLHDWPLNPHFMAKVKAKTTENNNSVAAFIKKVPGPQRQKDAWTIIEIMREQSGFESKMWGPAIIGFGRSNGPGDRKNWRYLPGWDQYSVHFFRTSSSDRPVS